MAMYYMNGDTFLKQYVNEDPKKVLDTQFVLISSTIRKNGKYGKQIINANNNLYPSMELIMDYDDYKHNENYREEYFLQLESNKPLFATLIKYVIEEGYTIVFLCGKREKKYNYLKMIQEFIKEEFHFHIYDYKKYKEGKEKIIKYEPSEVLHICDKILKKAEKAKKKKMMSTEKGRKEIISSMTKKELKKELKSRDLYIDGMSRYEMEDMLNTFM